MVDCGEDVHQYSVVWSLVKIVLVFLVVFVHQGAYVFKHLGHKFVFVETKHGQEHNNELYEAINIS